MNPVLLVSLLRRLQASCCASSVSLVLLRGPTARTTSTCLALQASSRQAPPTDEERLSYLRSAEKRVAVVAVGSLLVGYVALKVAFSGMAAKKQQEQQASPGSGSGSGIGPRPLVVAGPSGSGKSSLLKLLFKDYPNSFGFSVSHTTRKPRQGETDGKEYYFTSREEMRKSIDSGNFIEWAEFSGNMYGTSKQAVQDVQAIGKVCVLDIDMQGVRSLKTTNLNPLYIFIKPPSMEELEKRLRLRKTESEESLQKRLQTAKEEMVYADTPGVFDHVVVNDDLDHAYHTLRTIISKEMGFDQDMSSKVTDTER